MYVRNLFKLLIICLVILPGIQVIGIRDVVADTSLEEKALATIAAENDLSIEKPHPT